MRVLGIDPGLRLTGYGCVQADDRGETALIEAGIIKLQQRAHSDDADQQDRDDDPVSPLTPLHRRPKRIHAASVSARLVELERDLCEALDRLKPEVVAVEALFAHYKHPATAITMGHARGVILLCIRRAGLQLVELKPNEVKKYLTGHGHADKEQMQEAIRWRLNLASRPEPADVADAIAIALCASSRLGARVL